VSLFFAALLAAAQPQSRLPLPATPRDAAERSTDQEDRSLDAPTGSENPPSPSKLALIRRYLELNGTQRRIDTGSFLEGYALPDGRLSQALGARGGQATLRELFTTPMDALRRAYEPHRQVWQQEYERHVNWEYSEVELREIVTFLESRAGRHFLTGEWRMNAYVGTNTEELLEQIVRTAETELRSSGKRR
jgi:hypothetical protein